jgi:hypothetical protein
LEGAAYESERSTYESERSTAVPLSYRADGTPERFTFQSEASERISFGSTLCGTPLAEPLARWTYGSEASAAPNVPRAGCWGCPAPPICCPSDPVLCDMNMHDRRAVAPPESLSSDDEEEEEEEEEEEDFPGADFPKKMTLYPDTDDDEGEPQVKAAWELWPVPAPKSKRTPAAILRQTGPAARVRTILGTRPCEANQQAAAQAAPPVVARRPPGIHTFPVAKQTVAAPATAIGTPPPGIHSVPVAKKTLAASMTAPGVAASMTAPTAQETQAHAAHEWKVSRRARRANQPRITTLAVRNLHIFTSQQEFLDEVNRSGFAEKYDFAYLPRNFEDGSGKGVAFINFKTADAASSFAAAWHRSRRLSTEDETGQVAPLNVSKADLQGVEANLHKWTRARLTRVKNPDFLPFVLSGADPESQASGPEPAEHAAIAATKPR